MKLKSLMIIKALVCLGMGVPILAVPIFFYSLFGIKIDAAGALVGREYGAALIGNLLVTWFARNAVDSDARRAIILGLCIYDLIGFIFFLIAQLTGMMNPLGWLAVVIYLFFAVGFGYFYFKNPKP